MLYRVMFILLLAFIGKIVVANENSPPTEYYVVFPTYDLRKAPANVQQTFYSGEVVAMSVDEAGDLVGKGLDKVSDQMIASVEKLKVKICRNMKDADVKLTILLGAEGKLIVGASGQAGMEVTFHCEK